MFDGVERRARSALGVVHDESPRSSPLPSARRFASSCATSVGDLALHAVLQLGELGLLRLELGLLALEHVLLLLDVVRAPSRPTLARAARSSFARSSWLRSCVSFCDVASAYLRRDALALMFMSNSVTPCCPALRYTLAARSRTRSVMRATSACAAAMPACESAMVCFAWSISNCCALICS